MDQLVTAWRKGGSRNSGPLCFAWKNAIQLKSCVTHIWTNQLQWFESVRLGSTTMAACYLCLFAVLESSRRRRLHSQLSDIALAALKFQPDHCCLGLSWNPNLSPAWKIHAIVLLSVHTFAAILLPRQVMCGHVSRSMLGKIWGASLLDWLCSILWFLFMLWYGDLQTLFSMTDSFWRWVAISSGTKPSENRKEGLGDRLGWKCTERNVWNL